jgi:hypothetical protein
VKNKSILVVMLALILVSSALVPLTDTALAQTANPIRSFLPDDQVLQGETFNVSVTFTAPADGFKNIVLSSYPSGWDIQVNPSWCTPNADLAIIVILHQEGQYVWNGPYNSGQVFTAIYQVTVPSDSLPGTHIFSGQLEYHVNISGPFTENVGGDSDVTVTVSPTPSPTPTIIPPPPPSAIPTLSQWGMIGMAIVLAAALVWSVRKRWVIRTDKS